MKIQGDMLRNQAKKLTKHNPNSNGSIIIASMVLVLFAGIVALGIYKYTRDTDDGSSVPQPTPTTTEAEPTPTPTPSIDTSNWKTYTNEEYGISFKYPENWGNFKESHNLYITQDKTDQYNYSYSMDELNADLENKTPIFIFSSFAIQNSDPSDLESWIVKYDVNASPGAVLQYNISISNLETKYIGGDQIYTSNGNGVFAFHMYYTDNSLYPIDGYQEIFDEILKSVVIN